MFIYDICDITDFVKCLLHEKFDCGTFLTEKRRHHLQRLEQKLDYLEMMSTWNSLLFLH
jgi:hypothetical protein